MKLDKKSSCRDESRRMAGCPAKMCSCRACSAKIWQSKLCRYMIIILLGGLMLSCGSGDNTITPTGPDLDVSELSAIRIDQLKFTGGIDDDDDGIPEAAVYLRCRESGAYIACAGRKDGLAVVKKSGLSYGRLDAGLEPVEGAEGSCLDVEVVFVEKDSDDCPAAISPDDDIVAISSPVGLDETGRGSLIGNKISSNDGANWVRLIAGDIKPSDDLEQSAAVAENNLMIDQLYFTRPEVENKSAIYKVVVKDAVDIGGLRCEASFDETSGIIKEDIIYGGLNIQLSDTTGTPCTVTDENKNTKVNITLTILTGGGSTVENLATDPKEEHTLIDLVDNDGMRERFTGDAGFIRFTPIEGM